MGPADPRCRLRLSLSAAAGPPAGAGPARGPACRQGIAYEPPGPGAWLLAVCRPPARKYARKRPASAVSLWCLLSFRAALNCCCSTEHIHIGHIHNAVARIPTLVTHTPDSPERYTPNPSLGPAKQHTSTGATISCCCCCSTQRAQPEPPDPKHGSRYSRTVVWPLPVSTSVVSSAFPSR